MYVHIYICIYIYIGGWGVPNREIVSFRSCVRCEAVCVCLRDDVAPHRWVYFATKSSGWPAVPLPAGWWQSVSQRVNRRCIAANQC